MCPISFPDGSSRAMQDVRQMAGRIAESNSTVLLLGENGSGKDFLAEEIHQWSRRRHRPLVPVNCSTIPADLFESELFGHEKGAFTGALLRQVGLIESAQGGTLLLNEIGEMPLHLQPKLLTFLDKQHFRRVGGRVLIPADVRIIAATNRDLAEMVVQGSFREDLFYRLNVLAIIVPPLRERKEDIPVLVRALLSRLAAEMKLGHTPTVDSPALERLAAYQWPGNVRELRNVLERALVQTSGRVVIDASAIMAAMSQGGNGTGGWGQGRRIGRVHNVADLSTTPTRLEITDEQLKLMIEVVFGGVPTPVTVLMEVLGWTRKETSAAVKRVGCPPGTAGRLPERMKVEMIRDVRSWLSRRGML